MDPLRFAAGLDTKSADKISSPPTAKSKPSHTEIELSRFSGPSNKNDFAITPAGPQTPAEAYTAPTSGWHTPKTPNQLEAETPPLSGDGGNGNMAGVVMSFSNPPMNRWRVLCACFTYFGNGMSDAAVGALIPYMEKDYGIGYAVVSLIFVTQAVGFITTSFMVDTVQVKIGRARTLMLSEIIFTASCVMLVCTPPFPVVVVAYLFLGLGYAFNLALNNVFAANMANSTVILGAAHGSYGIGGIVGPIVATAMVSRGVLWSRFFLIILTIRVVVFFFAWWSNKGYEAEMATRFSAGLQRIASLQRADDGAPSQFQLLLRALKNRTTVIGALYIFAYQGAEVSISGWVISYLIAARGGDPAAVGYVTAGFWGGITLGRFVLTHLAPRVGEKLFVTILMFATIGFQLLVWLIPNIIAEAIAVSILGLLLGPIYPCSQTIFTRLLPSNIQMTSISFISSAGSSGGAVVPLLVGLLSQAFGTYVLHPTCIAAYAVMIGCWFFLPKVAKPTE